MDEQQSFDFLDLITIFSTGLQVQGYVNAVTKRDIAEINRKLDRLLYAVEGSNTDAGSRPCSAR